MTGFDAVAYALAKKALLRSISPTLSNLIIDTSKDWKGYSIRNIGAPTSDSDVPRARASDILSGIFDPARIPDLDADASKKRIESI